MSFVERWAEVAEPTDIARLAQARAFLELRLMDRAWIRLRELNETSEKSIDAQILTGRMFIERGWQGQAKKALEQALKGVSEDAARAEIRQLLAAAQTPPAPEPEAPDGDGDIPALLVVAEFHLSQGALLKAQRVLERVKRVAPDDQRAADLLWALHGDFTIPETEWHELIERYGAEFALPNDMTEESEHTEAVQRVDPATLMELDDLGAPSFPSLFRSAEAEEDGRTDSGDVTITSAVPALLREKINEEADLAGGDTQIVRVIHNERGGDLGAARGGIHLPSPAAVPFDLATFRREMGVDPQENTPISEFSRLAVLNANLQAPISNLGHGTPTFTEGAGVEEEDDERIVFTRREPIREEAPPEDIEPDAATPVPITVETEAPVRAPVRHTRSATDGVAWWLLMLAALGALTLIGLVLIVTAWLLF